MYQAPSSWNPLRAASRVYHMLLFSSLSPAAAWQQVLLPVFASCLLSDASTGWCHHPGLPASQRTGGQATRRTSTPSPTQPGLSWAHHRACQEMIKEYLLNTSGQQSAAPSPSSPLHPQALVPIQTVVNHLPSTEYQVLSTEYQVPAGTLLLTRMLALTSDLSMLQGCRPAVHS